MPGTIRPMVIVTTMIPIMVAIIPAVVAPIIAVVIPIMVSVVGAGGAILIVAMRVAGTRALRAGLVGTRIVGGTVLAPGVNSSGTVATR